MSATHEVTLWCDFPVGWRSNPGERCIEWIQFNDHESQGGNVRVARTLAKEQGWTWSRVWGDRCKKHPLAN